MVCDSESIGLCVTGMKGVEFTLGGRGVRGVFDRVCGDGADASLMLELPFI